MGDRMVTSRILVCLALSMLAVSFKPAWSAPDYVPGDESLQRMRLSDARKVVRDRQPAQVGCFNCTYIAIRGIRIDEGQLQVVRADNGKPLFFPLLSLKLEVEKFAFGTETGLLLENRWYLWFGNNFGAATRLADALFVIKTSAAGRIDGQEEQAFLAAVKNYRENPVKPEFPEGARRYRVQAEAAVREKRLDDAVNRYEEALTIAPWWPEGRFNRALILGELKEYAEATVEMKRYLALVPDAPNARAAQDQIYAWEGRAGRK